PWPPPTLRLANLNRQSSGKPRPSNYSTTQRSRKRFINDWRSTSDENPIEKPRDRVLRLGRRSAKDRKVSRRKPKFERPKEAPRPEDPAQPQAPTTVASLPGLAATALALLLALIVIGAFYPCLYNDFVNWDDDTNFIENPGFRGLGWSQ